MKDFEPYDVESLANDIKESTRRMSEILIKIDKLQKTKNKIIKAIVPMVIKKKSCAKEQTKIFTKPEILNNFLISFFKLDPRIPLSIMDVHVKFNHYIALNNLRDPINRLKINPNKELIELFNLEEGDQLNFLNLSHYVRKVVRRKSI